MSSEFIYRNNYSIFITNNSEPNSPGNIAMDKIFYLIERVFD
jgi:hypothetical protein